MTGGGIEVACRFEHDLFVKVKLVGADARASLENGRGIVVPFEASLWIIPVDGPRYNELRS